MKILLLSTYELGHQPLGLARPAAHLAAAGFDVRCQDLAIEHLDEGAVREARLVGISVPMHTATRLGARLAERVRALNPDCHVCFYGLYASLHADVLLGALADSVIGGEFEGPLVALANQIGEGQRGRGKPRPYGDGGSSAPVGAELAPPAQVGQARAGHALPLQVASGIRTADHDGGVFLGRQSFELPRRDLLPPLERYARVEVGRRQNVVGYVEASRGCAHRCLHCPITPVYGGRLRVVGQEIVLDDIRQLVAMGAEHITFGDPDFFNGIRHSLRIVEAMHAEFPSLTFDATIKVEHILEHRRDIPTLAANGCLFIVSAVEAVQDHILENFRKGHTAADVGEALAIVAAAGIPLRPTFVPFTPWTSLDDYLGLLEFIDRNRLVHHVDSVQLVIRLLVPRGSSLIGTPAMDRFLGPFDPATFSHTWSHPNPRVESLQRGVSALVEQAVREGAELDATFARVYELATAAAGRSARPLRPAPNGTVPRLTEPWFC